METVDDDDGVVGGIDEEAMLKGENGAKGTAGAGIPGAGTAELDGGRGKEEAEEAFMMQEEKGQQEREEGEGEGEVGEGDCDGRK